MKRSGSRLLVSSGFDPPGCLVQDCLVLVFVAADLNLTVEDIKTEAEEEEELRDEEALRASQLKLPDL